MGLDRWMGVAPLRPALCGRCCAREAVTVVDLGSAILDGLGSGTVAPQEQHGHPARCSVHLGRTLTGGLIRITR